MPAFQVVCRHLTVDAVPLAAGSAPVCPWNASLPKEASTSADQRPSRTSDRRYDRLAAETDRPLPAQLAAASSSSSSSREHLAAEGATAEAGAWLDFRIAVESATGELSSQTELGQMKQFKGHSPIPSFIVAVALRSARERKFFKNHPIITSSQEKPTEKQTHFLTHVSITN